MTKRELTTYVTEKLCVSLEEKGQKYVIGGNGKTRRSWTNELTDNNHEEADSLIAHEIKLALDALQNEESSVRVFSNDTDVFCILLSLLEELNCANMLIQLSKEEFVNLKTIQSAPGKSRSRAAIRLHTLTGCERVDKFWGKSKAYWTKQSRKANDVDMGKLPPTEGSFKQHFQVRVWYNATTALVNLLQPTEYGWMYTDEGNQLVGTKDPVVPDDMLQICSCKSGNYATKACKCRLSNI